MATQSIIAGTGASSATTYVGDTGLHTPLVAWASPGNITADDGSLSTVTFPALTGSTHESEYLLATNFGFTIPAGSTILGITAVAEASNTGALTPADYWVRLLKAGSLQAESKGNLSAWAGDRSYGNGSDLWSTSWTSSDINNSSFGVGFLISPFVVGGNQVASTASVDKVTITVTYTPAFTKTHTTNSFLTTSRTKNHTTNSSLKKIITKTHTTSSFLAKRSTRMHTANSNLKKNKVVSHTTSSFTKKIYYRTHTTNSLIRKRVFSAKPFIRDAFQDQIIGFK